MLFKRAAVLAGLVFGALPAGTAGAMPAGGAAPATAGRSPAQVRVGSAPRRPGRSKVVGSLASSTRLPITVTLKPRDPAALATYAAEVSTPGSPLYHHYLTVAQFRNRFGPSAQAISDVESSLATQGLRPGAVSANGLAINVTATAGELGHAFSTGFQKVALAGGRTAFANTQAPQFSASVADSVQGVIGLDSLAVPHPQGIRTPAHRRRPRRRRARAPGGHGRSATVLVSCQRRDDEHLLHGRSDRLCLQVLQPVRRRRRGLRPDDRPVRARAEPDIGHHQVPELLRHQYLGQVRQGRRRRGRRAPARARRRST